MSRRVVVTGTGSISPLGNQTSELWDGLINGRSGAGQVTKFDTSECTSHIAAEVKNFDPTAFGIGRKESRRMDLFVQFAVAAGKAALEDANYQVTEENADRIGVIVGSGIGGLGTMEKQYSILVERGPRKVSPFMVPMLIVDMAAGHLSIVTGARGPNFSTSTACASGTHAIGTAFDMIRCGRADAFLCGGTEAAITPLAYSGFCSAKALTTRNDDPTGASRPFDLERNGFLISEGAGIIVIEELESALKRGANILAEIVGYGLTGDAYHMTAPAPGGTGAAKAMAMALADAKLNPAQVGYINAHGTSTPLNDKFETMAIKAVFKDEAYRTWVSSTKSMTGHMLGAAGGIEAIIAAYVLKNGIVPPTINYTTPDPDCDLDYVPNTAREKDIQYALSNSLGFGGHNATLILGKWNGA